MRFPFEHHVQQPNSLKRYRLYFMLSILVLLVIFTFSALPPNASSAQSGWLQGLMQNMLGLTMSERLVRKLAHFVEYAILGVFSSLAWRQTDRSWRGAMLVLGLGMFAAFLDESIQIFSGRGPAIQDVWIDFSGLLAGFALVQLTSLIYSKLTNKKPG